MQKLDFASPPTHSRLMALGRDFRAMSEAIQSAITVGSGDSATSPKQCRDVAPNTFAMLKQRPCLVTRVKQKKVQTGQEKVQIFRLDIFTRRPLNESHSPAFVIRVPVVKIIDFELLAISKKFRLTMRLPGAPALNQKFRLPEGQLGDQIKANFDAKQQGATVLVSVVSACGEEQVLGCNVVAAED
ncbi:Eukaryotic translation initiation factor 5A [Aphelenchoides fujianensis]|nr:Eukaryotic translation initiation factor 5A [Aphelenchoides fujianensis]